MNKERSHISMSTELDDILRLNKSHINQAVKVLAEAFQNYPLFNYYYDDELTKNQITHHFLSIAIFSGMRYGEIYATSHNFEGVAVWIPSDKYPMTLLRLLCSVPLSILFSFGRYGSNKMRHLGGYIDEIHQRLAPFKHWYLWTVGVEPQYQGKGHASKLLRPMLARIDKEGLQCYLETLDKQNVPIYEHLGFKVVDKANVHNTSFTNWAMLREKPN
ncbi:GNAT family N-acetyltransferase [Chloroflexota bacterium]